MSRRTIVRTIEEEYEAIMPLTKDELRNCSGRIAITCDGWSSRVMRGYFVTSVHWISNNFEMKHLVLDFLYFPAPHNKYTTCDLILKVLKDFDLEGEVRCVTTDSGSEMGPALTMVREKLNDSNSCQLPEDWHIRCACHIVHNAVRACISTLSKQLENLRDTVKSIRMSQKLHGKFREAQALLCSSTCKEAPCLDIDTRWSSTFTMVQSSYDLRNVFESLTNDADSGQVFNGKHLSDEDW